MMGAYMGIHKNKVLLVPFQVKAGFSMEASYELAEKPTGFYTPDNWTSGTSNLRPPSTKQSLFTHCFRPPEDVVSQNLRQSLLVEVPDHKLEENETWHMVGWYMVSSAFPIVAASFGPIANLCSIASIADPWRQAVSDPTNRPTDVAWVLALNGVSLLFGVVSNITLLIDFSGTVSHMLCQTISIAGWFIASFILLGILVACEFVYFKNGIFSQYQGYWYGVYACILYFFGAVLLSVDEIGRIKKKYTIKSFRLTAMQRRLMVLNISFVAWLGMGAAVFSRTNRMSYGDGVYFSIGVCLTVAPGNIVPTNNVGRALVIPYTYLGLLLVGLSISAIRSAILEANGSPLVYRRVEKARRHLFKELINKNGFDNMTAEEAFGIMRDIHIKEKRQADMQLVFRSLAMFLFFLFIGSMVFCLCEDWSFFIAFYFSSLVFTTNGFGDFAPQTSVGRSFFVVWSIGAIPMMTILVSSLGGTIFTRMVEGGDYMTALTVKIVGMISRHKPAPDSDTDEKSLEPGSTEAADTSANLDFLSCRKPNPATLMQDWPDSDDDNTPASSDDVQVRRMLILTRQIRTLSQILSINPASIYSFSEWSRVLKLTHLEVAIDSPVFWLSNRAPLRVPIVEPCFFLLTSLTALDEEIASLIQKGNNNIPVNDRRKLIDTYFW
jgi:potassium channel subfamily K